MARPSSRLLGLLCSLALASTICCRQCFANDWGPPREAHWSANGTFLLKVRWLRNKDLSLWEKTDDGLKQHWIRGYVDLVRPTYMAYVSDSGNYVVLRDVHAEVNEGKVIVILGRGGEILGSYELKEFLPESEIISASRRSRMNSRWSENA